MTTPSISDVYETLAELAGLEYHPEAVEVRALLDQAFIDAQRLGGKALKEFGRLRDTRMPALTPEQEQLVEGLFDCKANGWVSNAGPFMRHGVWDHFKGGLYMSTGGGQDAESGFWQVRYISLYHGTEHHRRAVSWNEVVKWPDGRYRSRFIYRGLAVCEAPSFRVAAPEKLRAHLVKAQFGV